MPHINSPHLSLRHVAANRKRKASLAHAYAIGPYAVGLEAGLRGLRRLGCRYTSDPYYAVTAIFTARQ